MRQELSDFCILLHAEALRRLNFGRAVTIDAIIVIIIIIIIIIAIIVRSGLALSRAGKGRAALLMIILANSCAQRVERPFCAAWLVCLAVVWPK